MAGLLNALIDLFIDKLSYLGIFLVLTLCGTGLPIPEEVPVLAAAVLSHPVVGAGVMKWYLALPSCFIGAICGDCVMYAAGYHWGYSVLRNHRWFVQFQHPEKEPAIEQVLHRHGLQILLGARFLVGLRSPIYLAAGILRIPFRRFLVYDAIAAVPVIGLTFALGYFGAEHVVKAGKYAVFAVLVVAGLVALGYWYMKRRYFNGKGGKGAPPEQEAVAVGPRDESQPLGDDPLA